MVPRHPPSADWEARSRDASSAHLLQSEAMLRQLVTMLPNSVATFLIRTRNATKGVRLFVSDYLRFSRYHSPVNFLGDQRNLEARIIFHSHAIEKGLSHEQIRPGFGGRALRLLTEAMSVYIGQGYTRTSRAYVTALSVLKEYQLLHDSLGVMDTPLATAPEWLLAEVSSTSSSLGGVKEVAVPRSERDLPRSFDDVVFARSSIREFGSGEVDSGDLRAAVAVASRAPSVCNRQGVRVRIITEPDLVTAALDIQGGLNGYPRPPTLLVVTSDVRGYVSADERNQPYIDGGFFAMALLLGLESRSLAACALNANFGRQRDEEMRMLLGAEEWEAFIMFVAVGPFPESVKVPKSFRYSVDELVV